jgi:hypothetical protein
MPFDQISTHIKFGWKAQPKVNDMHLCMSLEGDDINLYTRHDSKFKRFRLPDFLRTEIKELAEKLGLDESAWSYLDGGVLHNKHSYFQNTIALWDILVRDNEYLTGTTYEERHNWLLEKVGGEPYYIEIDGKKWQIGVKVTEHIFIVTFFDDPQELWDLVNEVNEAAGWKNEGEPLLEGMVLKSPDGILKPGRREKNNSDWITRCRIRTGRHRH